VPLFALALKVFCMMASHKQLKALPSLNTNNDVLTTSPMSR